MQSFANNDGKTEWIFLNEFPLLFSSSDREYNFVFFFFFFSLTLSWLLCELECEIYEWSAPPLTFATSCTNFYLAFPSFYGYECESTSISYWLIFCFQYLGKSLGTCTTTFWFDSWFVFAFRFKKVCLRIKPNKPLNLLSLFWDYYLIYPSLLFKLSFFLWLCYCY